MTDSVRALLSAPLPCIVVAPWIGLAGWPTHRVFIDASAFDQDGGDSIVHNLPSGHRPRSTLSLNVHNFEEWP